MKEKIIKYLEEIRNSKIKAKKSMDGRHKIPKRMSNEIGELNGMIHFLNGNTVNEANRACLMDSSFICPINCHTPLLCADCDWYRQANSGV